MARSWEIEVTGLVRNPTKITVGDLIDKMHLEERYYRHRCVEVSVAYNATVGAVRLVPFAWATPASAPGGTVAWRCWLVLVGRRCFRCWLWLAGRRYWSRCCSGRSQ